jgi:hypothetical protein
MRAIRLAKPVVLFLAAVISTAGCTNVFRTEGLVLNPTYVYPAGDTEAPRFPRVLVHVRKETRVEKQNRIVGVYSDIQALKPFQEYAAIPDQRTDGDALYVDTRIFSNYKDELADKGLEKYDYWLELPDGRKIPGKVHVQRGLKDYSSTLSGAHMQTHQIVRDSYGVHAYRHVEEVQDEFNLYSRSGRILFVAPHLVDKDTPYIVFVIKGYEREWRYRFDFTNDPYKAAAWAAAHQDD